MLTTIINYVLTYRTIGILLCTAQESKIILNKLDTNHDGVIDAREWVNGLLDLYVLYILLHYSANYVYNILLPITNKYVVYIYLYIDLNL